MTVSRAMMRLLRIREIEEEQIQGALDAAMSEMRQIETALAAARERERRGRQLVTDSVASNDGIDRIAGQEEARAAEKVQEILTPRIAEMQQAIAALREEFLGKRIERRQVETLIKESETSHAIEMERRAQQEIDDWFLRRGM